MATLSRDQFTILTPKPPEGGGGGEGPKPPKPPSGTKPWPPKDEDDEEEEDIEPGDDDGDDDGDGEPGEGEGKGKKKKPTKDDGDGEPGDGDDDGEPGDGEPGGKGKTKGGTEPEEGEGEPGGKGRAKKDEDGNVLDKDGSPIDRNDDGELVDEDGNLIDKDGNPASKDEDGNLTDKDGNPINKDGEIVDEDGNPVDGEGEPGNEPNKKPESRTTVNKGKSHGPRKAGKEDLEKSINKLADRGLTIEQIKELNNRANKPKVSKIDKGMGMGGVISPAESREMMKEYEVEVESPSEEEIKQRIQTAVKIQLEDKESQGPGKGTGNWARTIMDNLKPQVDWKAALKKYIGRALAKTNEYYLGNRRFIGQGTYLTADKKAQNAVKGALYCVDTSGSMGDKSLSTIITEIKKITEEKKIKKTTIVYFDDGIQDIIEFDKPGDVKAYKPKPVGGGGTTYVDVYAKTLELWKTGKYDIVFFLTDADYKWCIEPIKNKPPKFRNKWIWVFLNASEIKPIWGDMSVHINTKDLRNM